jgi:O-acetyl-ADP-ribose deacetylase (regulator of RNase III)
MNTILYTHFFPSGQRLELVSGDLTLETVDAVVNAANSYLRHGGGVAGAIVQRGGPEIQAESDLWVKRNGPVTYSLPAYTGAGRLPCKFIIHAVGPIWGEGDEDEKLAQAISGSLQLADQLGLVSLAIPPISTGIFGFPKERAAQIFYATIAAFFTTHASSNLKQLRLTIIDAETLAVFSQSYQQWVDH